MKRSDAIQKLREYDNQYGKYVYLKRDLKNCSANPKTRSTRQSKRLAWKNLKATRRNLDLVDMEALKDNA